MVVAVRFPGPPPLCTIISYHYFVPFPSYLTSSTRCCFFSPSRCRHVFLPRELLLSFSTHLHTCTFNNQLSLSLSSKPSSLFILIDCHRLKVAPRTRDTPTYLHAPLLHTGTMTKKLIKYKLRIIKESSCDSSVSR